MTAPALTPSQPQGTPLLLFSHFPSFSPRLPSTSLNVMEVFLA